MKVKMYAITVAMVIILLILSCLWPVFFLINVLSQISELFLTEYETFRVRFSVQMQKFEQLNNPKK